MYTSMYSLKYCHFLYNKSIYRLLMYMHYYEVDVMFSEFTALNLELLSSKRKKNLAPKT